VISRYEFIDAMKALFPVVLMCVWAGVSKSGFYAWLSRPASATAARRRELEVMITSIFEASDATYGYRRVHAELRAGQVHCSPELVRAVMRDAGLYPCQPKPFRPTTTEPGDTGGTPDLVKRDFTADTPGTKLVGDITYIPTGEGFAYLATVIDCCTKECIGYAIADHMRADLVCDALAMAARNYPLVEKCIFHSDRGTQYQCRSVKERPVDQFLAPVAGAARTLGPATPVPALARQDSSTGECAILPKTTIECLSTMT
jgi:putative transposase